MIMCRSHRSVQNANGTVDIHKSAGGDGRCTDRQDICYVWAMSSSRVVSYRYDNKYKETRETMGPIGHTGTNLTFKRFVTCSINIQFTPKDES